MRNIEQYKELHKSSQNYGASESDFLAEICLIINYLKPKVILDYGCGKGALIKELSNIYPDIQIYGYDPVIENKDFLPINKADLVINTDVLEHIPEDEIEQVIKQIASISSNVYFNLHHALAHTQLPNGENAHCTVKPLFWYYELFKKHFDTQTILEGRYKHLSVVLTFPIPTNVYLEYYNIINQPSLYEKNLINERLCKLEKKHSFFKRLCYKKKK